MLNILVTGGCGFIGSHTVFALLKKGYRVFIFDSQHYHWAKTDGITIWIKLTKNSLNPFCTILCYMSYYCVTREIVLIFQKFGA